MRKGINKRLLAAADFVREGAYLADVGTDHAYLPIYLLTEGKIERAVLSDINEGPLNKARENVFEANLASRVEFRLCNGAKELKNLGVTDYAICGMGGELIADIIANAPHLKDGNIRLILEPMSKPEALRSYLFENGFLIDAEKYVSDEGKHYVCILAHFVGDSTAYSTADAYFGREENFYAAKSDAFELYMKTKLSSLKSVIKGKKIGGADTAPEEELLSSLCERLKKMSD